MKIGIIDYGSGNFGSVWNSVNVLTDETKIIRNVSDFEECSHIILPGVGAFDAAMEKIRKQNLIEGIIENVHIKKKPFLGICVGMQILAEKGFEFKEFGGLSFVRGYVDKFELNDSKMILPHIGWNTLLNYDKNPLFKNVDPEDPTFYFVHSYHLFSNDEKANFTYSEYGYQFIAAVEKENIFGVQFHPEKSQKNGLTLLTNFITFNA